ncbi:EscU/YscU/HrcU family type III secretion system export apparatus switch protein [Thermotoga neapolitana]|uniref:Flagellar biosynthesis-related protein n=1 Tax=Thermotoga neapolitana (strain ATCC 49049 / DSM 4359 / NBRC 107923 / NS-E) TaxID=309803 RepID=B9K8I9_THENN|nr:EscU/YscU/HrcU family type III secretion system export apparatus switch protein [Thermotoga neapolitana]ACM23272.1 Flagellar biosynthesis-related protein [Thermotoga neapolitana DSM 4359]
MRTDDIRKAVALRYDPSSMNAPEVVAKGAGEVAEKIIEIAKRYGIPIEERPDLVDDLLRLELFSEIPEEMYLVIAENTPF